MLFFYHFRILTYYIILIMINRVRKISLLLLLCSAALFAQDKVDEVYTAIENGINAADAVQFTGYIREKAYISLVNGYSDYFSPNQAHYVLQDYLNFHEPIKFKFDNIKVNDDYSFATGTFIYFYRGSKKNSRVFVALKKNKEGWEISQLTIN